MVGRQDENLSALAADAVEGIEHAAERERALVAVFLDAVSGRNAVHVLEHDNRVGRHALHRRLEPVVREVGVRRRQVAHVTLELAGERLDERGLPRAGSAVQ